METGAFAKSVETCLVTGMFVYYMGHRVESARSNLPCVVVSINVAGSSKEETCWSGLATTERVDVYCAFVGGVSVADCNGHVVVAMEKTKSYLSTEPANEETRETLEEGTATTVIGLSIDGVSVDSTESPRGGEGSYPHDVVVFTATKELSDTDTAHWTLCHNKGEVVHSNRFTNEEEHNVPHEVSRMVEIVEAYGPEEGNAPEGRTFAEATV